MLFLLRDWRENTTPLFHMQVCLQILGYFANLGSDQSLVVNSRENGNNLQLSLIAWQQSHPFHFCTPNF